MTRDPQLRKVVAATSLALALVGCGAGATPSLVRPLGVNEVAVPTFTTAGLACGGVGFDDEFVLHGDPADPQVTWLEGPGSGRRDIAWLPGSSARFAPDLEVLDPSGRVIAHEGSIATGGCIARFPTWFVDFQTLALEVTEPPMAVEP